MIFPHCVLCIVCDWIIYFLLEIVYSHGITNVKLTKLDISNKVLIWD